MNNGLIAARYATALLEFAVKNNCEAKVYSEAKTVVKNFTDFQSLRKVLNNPLMTKSDKGDVVINAAGGKVCKPFEQFVNILLVNNREVYLQSIMHKYIDLYQKQKNIHSGRLITATPMDVATENRLLKLIELQIGGTVEIEKSIDKDIIGGFMLEIDFVRWDASLKGQLRRIKENYIENSKSTIGL